VEYYNEIGQSVDVVGYAMNGVNGNDIDCEKPDQQVKAEDYLER
jgi:hypothetical protein